MRIAIISDIHGNLVALDAVLDDITREGAAEHIVCLGDVAAFGPQPAEVVSRLREIGCPVVMGDTDATFLTPEASATDELLRRLQEIDAWGAARLLPADRAYMGGFAPTLAIDIDNGAPLLCYHGSPRSFKDRIYATTSDAKLSQMFAGYRAQLFAGGHTHIQMLRRYEDAFVLNPGSVGLAYDRVPSPGATVRNPPWGEYAILSTTGNSLSVDLRRVPFAVATLKRAARANNIPHVDWWAAEWDEA